MDINNMTPSEEAKAYLQYLQEQGFKAVEAVPEPVEEVVPSKDVEVPVESLNVVVQEDSKE